jgi:hypothetical protein
MDMGTERIVSRISRDQRITLHFKMEQYDGYLPIRRVSAKRSVRGHHKPWGEFAFATVLFVTDSDARMNNIRREMLDLPPALHPYYRFTFELAAANFLSGDWKARSADDDRGYMLVR